MLHAVMGGCGEGEDDGAKFNFAGIADVRNKK
jgi:hypothetical protein